MYIVRLVNAIQEQTATVLEMPKVLGKTEQRVRAVLDCLKGSPSRAFSYAELTTATSMPYDALLYVLHALAEVGLVDKQEVAEGPGRPRVVFQWAEARVTGTRQSARGR